MRKPEFDPKRGTNGNSAAEIAAEFATCMVRGDTPDSTAAQSAAKRWVNNGVGRYGETFDADAYGIGTAGYIAEAVEYYRSNAEKN